MANKSEKVSSEKIQEIIDLFRKSCHVDMCCYKSYIMLGTHRRGCMYPSPGWLGKELFASLPLLFFTSVHSLSATDLILQLNVPNRGHHFGLHPTKLRSIPQHMASSNRGACQTGHSGYYSAVSVPVPAAWAPARGR